MSKNAIFVLALERIEISENLGRGDKISNNLYITNDKDIIRNHTNPDFEAIIGRLEYAHLFETKTIIYGLHDLEYGNSTLHQRFIVYNIRQVQNFLISLWLSFDNAVDFNFGFLEVTSKNSPPMVSSNNVAIAYSDSRGLDSTLVIDREKLREARLNRLHLWGNFPDFSSTMYTDSVEFSSFNRSFKPFREQNSIDRCFFYLNFARSEQLLPVKISQYCICFECLFSTDSTEISHKVSERVAYFLESEGFDRRIVYGDVRLAYKIRSSVVHGSTMPRKAKAKDLDLVSEKCDIYLRKSILKILNDPQMVKLFSSRTESIEDYLIALCLGQDL